MSAGTAAAATRRTLWQRAVGRARRTLFPTEHERAHRRWVADRGDDTLRLAYPLDADAVVFDVGGYRGDWAAAALERFGCTVHVFEPVPAFADQLEQRFAGRAGAVVHAYGLAGRTREERFTLAADGSSALREGPPGPLSRLRAARDVFDELALARVDLMKVNIEGGEYELLEHLLDQGLMTRIDNLQVQFHDFVPDAARRMRDLQQRLAATHQVQWQYPFVWESWRRATPAPGARGAA